VCRPTCTPEELSEGGLPASGHRAEPCPLSVLAGELTMVEAARREKVSEQSIGRWKAYFLGGQDRAHGREGPVPQPGRKSLRLRSRT
jgi:transposase